MGLRGYLLKRSLNTVILIFFVISLNFAIFILMPGEGAAIDALTANPKLSAEDREELIAREQARYGLNDPLHIRYFKYVQSLLTFNFGYSFQTGQPVMQDMISSGRLTNTLVLLGTAEVLALILGIFLGVVAAYKRGSLFDSISVTGSLTTFSLPVFWMGLLFIFLFGFILFPGWPTAGVKPYEWALPEYRPDSFLGEIPGRLQHLFLPALTLTLFLYGGNLLLTRATMLETLSDDYITTARAKGIPERKVLFKHALRNASLPIVTSAALSFGFILSGAIITETVFSWDGMGYWLWGAIGWKDRPVMQAVFYLVALCVIAANFIADVLYGVLDPRIKYD